MIQHIQVNSKKNTKKIIKNYKKKVLLALSSEKKLGYNSKKVYLKFSQKIIQFKKRINLLVSKLKANGKKIACYGASDRGLTLINYANLDKKVVMIGQGNKFEIWDEAGWQAKRDIWLKEESSSEGLPDELQTFLL